MKTILEKKEAEITEKKSRFIGIALPLADADEAREKLADIKRQYRDARHYCFALRVRAEGEGGVFEKYSDDGEPQGTAGKPILSVLRAEELTDIMVVVVRYFGGTLLGTGGLVRAYTGAAKECIDMCREEDVVIEKDEGYEYRIGVEYSIYGKIERELEEESLPVINTEYSDKVYLYTIVSKNKEQMFLSAVTDLTLGRTVPEKIRAVNYYKRGNHIVVEDV